MGERLLLALLSGLVGFLIGAFGPLGAPAHDAEQNWLSPPTPTVVVGADLSLSRPTVAQTAVPPTLAPRAQPTPVPPPVVAVVPPAVPAQGPPPAHTYTIALQGGGEMTVVASDEAAARNNVRSTGAVPAD